MKVKLPDNPVNFLRRIGLLEGTSFLILLFIAMPLKYLAGMPIAVRIVGSLHGFLFILFMFALFQVKTKMDWPPAKVLIAFMAALIPFGPFALDARLKKEEQRQA